MANHKSAEKRIRQTEKRTIRNRIHKSKMKSVVRSVKDALKAKDSNKALETFKIANKELHKLVSKGILPKNTAARKVSRLNKAVKSLQNV